MAQLLNNPPLAEWKIRHLIVEGVLYTGKVKGAEILGTNIRLRNDKASQCPIHKTSVCLFTESLLKQKFNIHETIVKESNSS